MSEGERENGKKGVRQRGAVAPRPAQHGPACHRATAGPGRRPISASEEVGRGAMGPGAAQPRLPRAGLQGQGAAAAGIGARPGPAPPPVVISACHNEGIISGVKPP